MKRDFGIDLTRVLAFCLVICVHFFWNTGFYNEAVNNMNMFFAVIARNMFMICVPLFIILTGFLMSNKNIKIDTAYLKYVKKISKVIFSYIISTVIIILYLSIVQGQSINLKTAIFNIVSFQYYSWYVEMYIGLYLMIPFLNILWRGLENRKSRIILIIVLLFLTALPTIVNVYDLKTLSAFIYPELTENYQKLIPSWWVVLYPITYYYIGAYIKCECNIKKIDKLSTIIMLFISVVFWGFFNVWKSSPNNFVSGAWCDWGSLQNTINAILVFAIINSFNYKKIPVLMRVIVAFLADLTFAAYILSFVADSIVYPKLNMDYNESFISRFVRFPMVVSKVLAISLLLSLIVYLITYLKDFVLKKIIFINNTAKR